MTWVVASVAIFWEIDWVKLFFVSLAIFSTVMAVRRWLGEREEKENGAPLPPSSPTRPGVPKRAEVIDPAKPSPLPVDVRLVIMPEKSPPTESPLAKPRESPDEPFVDKTPNELMDIYDFTCRTTAEADRIFELYRGKKLRSKFILNDVRVYQDGDVSVSVDISTPDSYRAVCLGFPKSYRRYFEHRAPGFEFTATGKIDRTDGYQLILADCEVEV